MPLRFDATLKDLLNYTDDWLARMHIVVHGPVEELSAELSTVTAAADKIFRIAEDRPWCLHLEFQSAHNPRLPRRVLKWNGLCHLRHHLCSCMGRSVYRA